MLEDTALALVAVVAAAAVVTGETFTTVVVSEAFALDSSKPLQTNKQKKMELH